MKLLNVLILSLSAALVIIGTHLTMRGGIGLSYPIFMFAVALLFWYRYRKSQPETSEKAKTEKKAVKKSKSKK